MSHIQDRPISHISERQSLGSTGQFQDLLVALEELRLCLEKALDDVLHQLASLVLELILGWAEDLLKNDDKLGCQALDGGLVGLV